VEIIDLRGLRMAELRQRLAALPEDSIIYFTTMTYEGDRPAYVSRDALVELVEIANRPIIVDLEGHIGTGSVGGLVADPNPVGREAALLARRILDGENPSSIPVVAGDFVRPIFDWRQLQRWGISEKNVPPGSEVRFRQPTAWEQYHWQIMLIAAALPLQTGLIIGLFYEHRRRRAAEVEARRRMSELAHVNRNATAGALSASIAHEIKQPLAAMVTNANAGLRWLSTEVPDLGEARAAFTRIANDGHRAGETVGSIQVMFKKDEEARVHGRAPAYRSQSSSVAAGDFEPRHECHRSDEFRDRPPARAAGQFGNAQSFRRGRDRRGYGHWYQSAQQRADLRCLLHHEIARHGDGAVDLPVNR
jgi:signal transduction histidine kinase